MAADEAAPRPAEATGQPSGAHTRQGVWATRAPRAPRALDDGSLLDCRDRWERPAMALALALVVLVVAALFQINDTVSTVLLAIIALWATTVVYQVLAEIKYLANGAEVTPTQCTYLYPLVEELRQRWEMPHTRVVVVFQPGLGVVSYGVKAPYVIRVDSLYSRSLDDGELRYVLGREMAHIKFGHTRWWALLGGSDREVPSALAWLAKPRNVIFAWWRRTQRTSADRAGILACGDVGKAISALVKYQVGPAVAQQVSIAGLEQQAAELTHGWEHWGAFFAQALETDPFLLYRLRLMVEWAGLPETAMAPSPDSEATRPPASTDAVSPRA